MPWHLAHSHAKPMPITWSDDIDTLDWQALEHLYRVAPLGLKSAAHLQTVFGNSRFRCFAHDDGQLVAAGRALADGADVFLFRVTDSAAEAVAARPTVDEQVEAARAQVALAEARAAQAQAAVDRAALELEYTKVKAELAGTISKRNVEPGQLVSPERALMAIVDLAEPWIVANLKETQLAELRPGQRVDIEIDSYPEPLTGRIDSIAAGTGARFSLLPPDNASGNFIKVTQRVPVKILLDDRRGRVLRPGMSAEVVIHTR